VRRRKRALVVSGVVSGTAAAAVAGVVTGGGIVHAAPAHDAAGVLLAASVASVQGDVASASPKALKDFARQRSRDVHAVSRSDRRTAVTQEKPTVLHAKPRPKPQVSATAAPVSTDPREAARTLLGQFGFSADQFPCLDALWTKESGWNVNADNPSSSAYGIPQALPGSKMATAGSDWATNAATQIRWGLGYIKASYGTPCGAWAHSQSYNWY